MTKIIGKHDKNWWIIVLNVGFASKEVVINGTSQVAIVLKTDILAIFPLSIL